MKFCFGSALISLFAMTLSHSACSESTPVFTALETDKSTTFYALHGSQALISFWRSDCAPCIAERPILNRIAGMHPHIQVVLVSLDGDAYKNRHFPAPAYANMDIWAANDAEKTLQNMGDKNIAIPFSLFLRADGTVCDRHYGLLGTDTVKDWMKRC